jgi:hypothetical protein
MVSLAATIAFLRAHGLDEFVDAYGVHSYPSRGNRETLPPPRNAKTDSTALILRCVTPEERPAASPAGSPNGDFQTPIYRALRRNPAALSSSKSCVPILPLLPPSIASWASTTLPGIPIHGQRSPTLTASIAAARSPRPASRRSPLKARRSKPDLGASMRVRVGVCLVARGPAPNIADNWFTEIKLKGPARCFRNR